MTTIEVPDYYGFVILGCIIVPLFSSFYMGEAVMKARKDFNVQYPNLYATPGYHKQADEFNRVQRGHQSMLESITTFTAASLLGGLKYPIAVSLFGILYGVGNILYLVGYSDTKLDVNTARFKKGGALKIVGLLGALGSCISFAGSLNGWW
jgi:glutathione S-transferase